jgi:hypothetical protein
MTDSSPTASADSLEWFKSSYSTNDGPNCIEVASAIPTIYVRDSKDKQGPRLAFSADGWAAFVSFAADIR